jgi:hypothetical protein
MGREFFMSSQVAANSIDALKDLRVALALYGEDTLSALGAIGAEIKRTLLWLQQDRPAYWQEQIKRRRERVATAKAEVFRRQLATASGSSPAMSEQVENLKRAEAGLDDAERRLVMTRKWQNQLTHAVLDYHASIRRIKSLAAGDVPSAVNLLTRLIDALEEYLRVSPVSAVASTPIAPATFETIATKMIAEAPPAPVPADDETTNELDGDGVVLEPEPDS